MSGQVQGEEDQHLQYKFPGFNKTLVMAQRGRKRRPRLPPRPLTEQGALFREKETLENRLAGGRIAPSRAEFKVVDKPCGKPRRPMANRTCR